MTALHISVHFQSAMTWQLKEVSEGKSNTLGYAQPLIYNSFENFIKNLNKYCRFQLNLIFYQHHSYLRRFLFRKYEKNIEFFSNARVFGLVFWGGLCHAFIYFKELIFFYIFLENFSSSNKNDANIHLVTWIGKLCFLFSNEKIICKPIIPFPKISKLRFKFTCEFFKI